MHIFANLGAVNKAASYHATWVCQEATEVGPDSDPRVSRVLIETITKTIETPGKLPLFRIQISKYKGFLTHSWIALEASTGTFVWRLYPFEAFAEKQIRNHHHLRRPAKGIQDVR